MRCLGESVSNDETPAQEPPIELATSTFKYTSLVLLKSKLSGSPPTLVSPIPTLNTPLLTFTVIAEGVLAGHRRLSGAPTVASSYNENLKQ